MNCKIHTIIAPTCLWARMHTYMTCLPSSKSYQLITHSIFQCDHLLSNEVVYLTTGGRKFSNLHITKAEHEFSNAAVHITKAEHELSNAAVHITTDDRELGNAAVHITKAEHELSNAAVHITTGEQVLSNAAVNITGGNLLDVFLRGPRDLHQSFPRSRGNCGKSSLQ